MYCTLVRRADSWSAIGAPQKRVRHPPCAGSYSPPDSDAHRRSDRAYPARRHLARRNSIDFRGARSKSLPVRVVSANLLAIIAASLVLAFAGSVATLIPARRAAFADPLETLRSE